MTPYHPYSDNPNSVIKWLSSHMALQYNWHMFVFCLIVSVLTVGLFYFNFELLSAAQNLIFHTGVFLLSILAIALFYYKDKPKFVTTSELIKFKRKKMITILFGADAIELIYYFLNFKSDEMQKKYNQSLLSPIDLLANMDDKELAHDTYTLTLTQGGIMPRASEPLSLAILTVMILSQWFFVRCLVDMNGALIYEPNWLRSFLDWVMTNHMSCMPYTEHNKGWIALNLEDSDYLQQLHSLSDVVQYPLFRSAVLYHFWTIITVPITLATLVVFFNYRRAVIAYDKVVPRYTTGNKVFKYIGMFFVYFWGISLLFVLLILTDTLGLSSIELNSPLPFFLFILLQSFIYLIMFYSMGDFVKSMYSKITR